MIVNPFAQLAAWGNTRSAQLFRGFRVELGSRACTFMNSLVQNLLLRTMIQTTIFSCAIGLLAGCGTTKSGEKETFGEALQRIDGSIGATVDRLQNKTYNE